MCIETLTERVKTKEYTHEERVELLHKAKILDDDGNYHKDYFTQATIDKDRKKRIVTN